METAIKTKHSIIANGLEHILLHHRGTKGWIAIFHKGEPIKLPYTRKSVSQWHYKLGGIKSALTDWGDMNDLYFSQNSFARPSRTIDNLEELKALYVDIDCYKEGMTPEQVVYLLKNDYFDRIIPTPNVITYSGRGLALTWWLQYTPAEALPLWQIIEDNFVETLKLFGADAGAKDASRVLRIMGTKNSKSSTFVSVELLHEYRFVLDDIQRDYLPKLPIWYQSLNERKKLKKVKKGNQKEKKLIKKVQRHRGINPKLFNVYSLYFARMNDLVKLCEMRNYVMSQRREITLFLYRYWGCCFLGDSEEALKQTMDLNEHFSVPLSVNEVVKATKSAEKKWEEVKDSIFDNNAYKEIYNLGGYSYSNEKLIETYKITDVEQMCLSTIISQTEKKRRNTVAHREARKASGSLRREEYLDKAKTRREEVIKMREQGMSFRIIGKKLGISHTQAKRIVDSNN